MAITREEIIRRLKKMQEPGDPMANHEKADKLLCTLLRQLGYADVVREWQKIFKWYA